MAINGTTIESVLCDKLKGIIDTGVDYTPGSLVAALEGTPNFLVEDLVAWAFNKVPTYGPADVAWGADSVAEQDVVNAINTWLGESICVSLSDECCTNCCMKWHPDPNKEDRMQSLVNILKTL